jgi:hypothetical protein
MSAAKQPDLKEVEKAMKEQEQHPVIIPELRDLLDTLQEESSTLLEEAILREGIRDPLIVWKERNAILDGHNRLRIAQKHSLPYKTVEKSLASVEEAQDAVGGLGALGEPGLDLVGFENHAAGVVLRLHRVVGAYDLDEAAIARVLLRGDDNAIDGFFLGAHTAKSNAYHRDFAPSCNKCSSIQRSFVNSLFVLFVFMSFQ